MTNPLEIFAANRDLALAEAEAMYRRGHTNLQNYAQGQAQAYAEAIRIIEAAAKPESSFRCSFSFGGSPLNGDIFCARPANHVLPDGKRYCHVHAPTDTDLTISEHDDQRAER